jgi:hypothetical protein
MDLNNKSELKRVWVDALRSGEYEQCQETLHNLTKGGYCCLGVALKVWDIATDEAMGAAEDPEGFTPYEGPIELYDKLRKVIDRDVVDKGIDMNDQGKPFPLIADMIETEWLVTEQ